MKKTRKNANPSPQDSSCEYTFTGHSKIPGQLEIMRVLRGAGEIHSLI